MIVIIRRLRHGPLSFMGPGWVYLGRFYRRAVRRISWLSITQKIGPYGPFKMLAEFTFTDLGRWGGAHNRGFDKCIEACRNKSCVLDVGAHVGFITLPAASVLAPGGRLYAFEPAKANLAMLRSHVKMNGLEDRVEIVDRLVGAIENDGVPFYESVGPHGQNSIILKSETTLQSEQGGYERTLHRQISLDRFCAQNGLEPQLIKIDVEGAEIGVLKGAQKIIEQSKPLLILSVHPREIALAGGSLEDLRDLIEQMGYEFRDVDGRLVEQLRLDEYIVAPRERHRA